MLSAKIALAALLAVSPATAHMLIKTPVPYGKSSLNNSPLDAAGSDFPCKTRPNGYADEGARAQNQMAIGSDQTLSFIGSAVHGGGSCQIALTTDKAPTKSSKWAVIKSIEGGCPANAAGNIGDDPNGSGASTFKYSIPQGIAPGDYTLAWTWFNKIGNREMYMNCAPITVTGGSKKRDIADNATIEYSSFDKRESTFPQMFVANAGQGDCHTADSQDLAFPDPGTVVQKAGSGRLTPPTGNCPKLPQIPPPAASGSGSAPAAPANSSAAAPAGNAAPATHTVLAGSAAPSASGAGVAAGSTPPPLTGGSGSSGSGSMASGAAPAGSAAPSAAVPAGSASPSGSSSTGSSSSSGSSGGLKCSPDGKSFTLEGSSVSQPVAAGTKCSNGAITFAKRRARFRAVNVGVWT